MSLLKTLVFLNKHAVFYTSLITQLLLSMLALIESLCFLILKLRGGGRGGGNGPTVKGAEEWEDHCKNSNANVTYDIFLKFSEANIFLYNANCRICN